MWHFLSYWLIVLPFFPPAYFSTGFRGLQLAPLCIPDTKSFAWCIKDLFIQIITVYLIELMKKKGLHITAYKGLPDPCMNFVWNELNEKHEQDNQEVLSDC